MKKVCSLLSALLLTAICMAQRTAQIEAFVRENPLRAACNKHCYEALDTTLTPVPSGYKPFYISHISRHGSRCHGAASDIVPILDTLRVYSAKGYLTKEGKSLIWLLASIEAEQSLIGYGMLTPLGAREHHDIAARMCRHYPEVFSNPARSAINTYSTASQRVMDSRDNFIAEVESRFSGLEFTRAISKQDEYANCEVNPKMTDEQKKEFNAVHTSPCRDSILASFDWSGAVRKTFVDGRVPARWKGKEGKLFYEIYCAASIRQCLDNPVLGWIEPYFTEDELFTLWKYKNVGCFNSWAWSSENKGLKVKGAGRMLKCWIEDAEAAIAGGNACATLRFSHDGCVLPLVSLMSLEWNDYRGSFRNSNEYFCSSHTMHMGGNLQMVFYRGRKGDVLVRILLNEQEWGIAGLKPAVKGVFYRWEDVREWFEKQMAL